MKTKFITVLLLASGLALLAQDGKDIKSNETPAASAVSPVADLKEKLNAEASKEESAFRKAFNKMKEGKGTDSKANTDDKKKTASGVKKPDAGIMSLGISPWRAVLALGFMAFLLGAFFYLLKKFGRRFTGTEVSAMKVKSRLQLDGKNALVIVKAYEEEVLLGIGTNGISLITRFAPIENAELEDEDTDENKDVEKNDKPKKGFNISLRKALVDSEEIKSMKDNI